ncbi:hypothetical protein DFH11DRAFT_1547510 [Phellopilus nigrolimitatus]|nr:hypothetical protein DFH11DRAFT_1547510 [Phellopilus nigrolimitatus]
MAAGHSDSAAAAGSKLAAQWTCCRASAFLTHINDAKKCEILIDLIARVYADLHFAYLEINPPIALDGENGAEPIVQFFDMAAKLDQTAESICGPSVTAPTQGSSTTEVIGVNRGPPMVWPATFNRQLTKKEAYIQKLDGSTGASLKLTVLNPEGCVWTMMVEPPLSTLMLLIAAHGFSDELTNYGEYSGAPIEGQTNEYAKTIVDLITRGSSKPDGKILIIDGGIANFTNVVSTLTIRFLGESLGAPIKVYGPDTDITEIGPIALVVKSACKSVVSSARSIPPSVPNPPPPGKVIGGAPSDEASVGAVHSSGECTQPGDQIVRFPDGKEGSARQWFRRFNAKTRSVVYGLQARSIQGILDFDYSCGRDNPSLRRPSRPEVLLGNERGTPADVVVNFASRRSVYSSTFDIMRFSSQIKTVAIVAERRAHEILYLAKEKDILIVGLATVGGIKAECFKTGSSGTYVFVLLFQ